MKEYLRVKKENNEYLLHKNVFETITSATVLDFESFDLKSVDAKLTEKKLLLNIEITAKDNTNLTGKLEELQEHIFNIIYKMTDYPCHDINIKVVGYTF